MAERRPRTCCCPGLLPYRASRFEELACRLSSRPRHILLNKVVTRDGLAEVPYQIRNAYEVPAAPQTPGYEILDEWTIDQLAHRIQTHPKPGRCTYRGYVARLKG
ncbi:hypothetical protein [Reyranella sp.]|jgi:hypothetical protein|uniref:hypothetical protein n=1 Tax=Reyranella sp. TaxID=1929291 RepID=UPI000BD1A026|nr:hypothetical protein [Reyranella sp.]OYY37678.1 MAG: hypothetical protein B7Y57_22940 [Rhodospirillales bacterium 35-66-84]OYZ92722.1 MAG: hypothetical protein B7Y08_20770 [Rhodospirillales bacterium 24-66-33]OZB24085.1 MAG: hypothetical protein B7X63_17635 [Rhodospirillales bacterium 39-66-50]HQS17441.1 hypothetical protein [Reyranella sp.]HQT13832.1 hypothetical protein [Reyranella sp.]